LSSGVETVTPERALFQLLVESIDDYAIFLLDPTGVVVTWNKGAARIKGYTPAEIIGQHFSRFYPEADRQALKPERELEAVLRLGRLEDEGIRVRKDGTTFWANVVLTTLYEEGRPIAIAKVTRDLTERRRAEEERVRLAQTEEALRLRDEFLSIASHELRTPLTALDLQVQSLAAASTVLGPRLARKVARIELSSARLRVLIETLLDVSRIATGRFVLTPSEGDLVATTEEVVDRLAERAQDAACVLTFEKGTPSARGSWDMVRMRQVVTNVLDNALTYGREHPVEVFVGEDAEGVVITITDHGPGIAESDLERIFERFERAAPMRNYGGLGLGLYVSRQIVQGHGGTISARNQPSGGARFSIRLPKTPVLSAENHLVGSQHGS
jgi:PAS domain S-box-containing protein